MKTNVYGYPIEIVEVSQGDLNNLIENKNTDYLGLSDFTNGMIYLLKTLNPECKKRTLAHELCHMIKRVLGYSYKKMDEEELCDFVSAHLDTISKIVNEYFKEENK